MGNIVIVGANSTIAEHCGRLFAQRGDNLMLVGRNLAKLEALKADFTIRGAPAVHTLSFDANDTEQAKNLPGRIQATFDSIDIVLIAYGSLPDQEECQRDLDLTEAALKVNFLSPVLLLSAFADAMAAQGAGCLACIGSVAGDRGRQSNYVYGTAKGGLDTFMQGLRNRLNDKGVKVLAIKPGFVDTAMTADFDKGALWAQPEDVASDIVKAIDGGKKVLYTPWFWRWIMLVIKTIPEAIFVKLKL